MKPHLLVHFTARAIASIMASGLKACDHSLNWARARPQTPPSKTGRGLTRAQKSKTDHGKDSTQ